MPVGFETALEGGRLRIKPGPGGGEGRAAGSGRATEGVAAPGKSAARGGGRVAEISSVPRQLKQRFLEVPCRHRLAALVAALVDCGRGGRPRKAVVFVSSCDAAELMPRLLQARIIPARFTRRAAPHLSATPTPMLPLPIALPGRFFHAAWSGCVVWYLNAPQARLPTALPLKALAYGMYLADVLPYLLLECCQPDCQAALP